MPTAPIAIPSLVAMRCDNVKPGRPELKNTNTSDTEIPRRHAASYHGPDRKLNPVGYQSDSIQYGDALVSEVYCHAGRKFFSARPQLNWLRCDGPGVTR